MLADERRRARVLRPLLVERERQRRQAQVRDSRMRERLQHSQRLGLGRLGHVLDVRDGCSRHAGCGEALVPDGGVVLPQALDEQLVERLAVRDPVGVRAEARVVDELGRAERRAQIGGEETVVAAADHQLAVAGGEDLVRGDHREDGSLAVRDRPVGEVAGEVVADVAERRLVQRHVDERAATRALALEQRRDDAEGGPGAGALVDQRRADANAGTIRLAR